MLILLSVIACDQASDSLMVEELEQWEKERISKELRDSANVVLQHANYTTAIELIDSANAIAPTAASYLRKAAFSGRVGDHAQAFSALDSAIELGSVMALAERGHDKLTALHDFSGAIEDINKCIAEKGRPIFIHARNADQFVGIAHRMLGEHEKAIEHFDYCIKAAGKISWADVYVIMYKALSHMDNGEKEKAIETINIMQQQCKDCPEAYFYKAQFLGKEDPQYCTLMQTAYDKRRFLRYWIYHEHFDQVYIEDIKSNLENNCNKIVD